MAKILIIEDNVEFRDTLEKMLQRKGYEVTVASDGDDGIEMFRDNPAQLVITDIIMPNKEGIETVSMFLTDFPETKFIAMSGGGKGKSEDYLKIIKKSPNVIAVFQKPFAMDEMLQAVREVLDNQ